MDTNCATFTAEDLLTHSAWLHRLAARLVSSADADDVVQDAWVAAIRSPPAGDRDARPWLAQVVRNLARNRARSASRWHARAEQVRAADDTPLPSAEQLGVYHEAQRLVAEVVAGLDEPFRSTVLLCYGEGLAPTEIARRLQIPAGTVRWRLKRALDDVRTRLDARYGQDRQAWIVALGPLAARTVRAGATASALALRVTPAKLALGLAAALAAVFLLVAPPLRHRTPSPAAGGEQPSLAVAPPGRPPRIRPLALAPSSPAPAPGPTPPGPAPAQAAALAVTAGAGGAPDQAAVERAMQVGPSPTKGPHDAPVTIVLYTDFQCPFCAKLVPTLESLVAAYPKEVRLVVKNLPLPFHEGAALAAEAALAAHEQGKFWPMHDRLFAHQDELSPAELVEHARAVGLNVERFKAALDSGKFRAAVAADMKLASEAGLNGTPAALVNGHRLMGAQPMDAWTKVIDGELRARGLPVPAAPPALAAAAPPPPDGRARIVVNGRFHGELQWPPPRLALPDAVLGQRMTVPFASGDAPIRGAARPAVEVLYLAAPACPFCPMAAGPIVRGLLRSYGHDLRIVARPIASPPAPTGNPEGARLAVAALWAAHAQGKFWQLDDQLTGGHGPIDRALIESMAATAGLDLGNLRAALDGDTFREQIEEDARAATDAHIHTWPAFVVDGRVADSPAALVQMVESALRKKGRRLPAQPAAPVVEVNPAAPGYSAATLQAYLSTPQIFAVEPRDDAWASAVEKELGPQVAADVATVDHQTSGVGLECRSTLCRLRATVAAPRTSPLFRFVSGVYRPRDMAAHPGQPTEWYFDLRSGAPTRPAAQSAAAFRSRRSTILYSLRTGRAPALPDLPVTRLPPE